MKSTLAILSLAAAAVALLQDPQAEGPSIVAEGRPAPAIRLNDHTGRAVALQPPDTDGGDSDRGWTVLAFFPKAATPG